MDGDFVDYCYVASLVIGVENSSIYELEVKKLGYRIYIKNSQKNIDRANRIEKENSGVEKKVVKS